MAEPVAPADAALLLESLEAALHQVIASQAGSQNIQDLSFQEMPQAKSDQWMQLEDFHRSLAGAIGDGARSTALSNAFSASPAHATEVRDLLNALGQDPPSVVECLCLCRPLEQMLKDLGSGREPIADEYEQDWSSVPGRQADRELRVEVLSVAKLAEPEYRLGDHTQTLILGPGAVLEQVYVEVRVGKRRCKTTPAKAGEKRAASWVGQKMLFDCCREWQLAVTVRDKRRFQSAFRGDPLIGQAFLALEGLDEGEPQLQELALVRKGLPAGSVSLRLQLLPLPFPPEEPEAAAEQG